MGGSSSNTYEFPALLNIKLGIPFFPQESHIYAY